MGMDVYGRHQIGILGGAPNVDTTSDGRAYFRENHFWFGPLATYCEHVAADEGFDTDWDLWHINDGEGLCETEARRLADLLTEELDSGRTAAWEAKLHRDGVGESRNPGLRALCGILEDAGYTTAANTPDAPDVPFSVETVRNWRDFLRVCGGFEIW